MSHRKRYRLIIALLEHHTFKAAAAAAGISEKTAHVWWADPAFQKEYLKECRSLVRSTMGRLQKQSVLAGAVLANLLQSKNDMVRLGAARSILQFATRAVEVADLEARIAELERLAGEKPSNGRLAFKAFGQN